MVELIGKFKDNILIIIGVLGFYYFTYDWLFSKWFSFMGGLITLLIFFIAYVSWGSAKWEQRYKAPKIIGNDINHSILQHRIINISSIIPNHHLIFLGGYQDVIGEERLGDNGVLLIDRAYYWVFYNRSLAIHPQIRLKQVNLRGVSRKYNLLVDLIEDKLGKMPKVYLACPKGYEQQLDMAEYYGEMDINSENIESFFNKLLLELSQFKKIASRDIDELRDTVTKVSDINSEKRSFFKRKKKEEVIEE